jgi:nicotinate-nucleotide pyrophosphorylase (carboxylating)
MVTMEIKWHDVDPETGQRRYLCAKRFAGVWHFRWKLQRRGEWTRGLEPTRAMWEHVLESMQRRYRRREGVDDRDLAEVEKILRSLPNAEEAEDWQIERRTEPRKRPDYTSPAEKPGPLRGSAGQECGCDAAETRACQQLISLAVEEDIGSGDITSQAVIPEDLVGRAVFVARNAGILCGLPAVSLVVRAVAPAVRFEELLADSSRVEPGARLATVAGSMRGILACERIALNFLQHLSGVASLTRKYVDAVAGLQAKILDTRKTLPGWRLLQKYAVRCGGGYNHRLGLFDGVLIKDNHLAAYPTPNFRARIVRAISMAREKMGDGENTRACESERLPVEIEVEDLEQLDAALSCGPDIILLDNMTTEVMREAVRRRDLRAPNVQLEASGGVNLQTVRAVAETGVDRISVGMLTHSAPALDIALDYER